MRALQRQQERERGRRVLSAESPGDGNPGNSDAEGSGSGGGGRGRQRKRRRTRTDEQVYNMPLLCLFCVKNIGLLLIQKGKPLSGSNNWQQMRAERVKSFQEFACFCAMHCLHAVQCKQCRDPAPCCSGRVQGHCHTGTKAKRHTLDISAYTPQALDLKSMDLDASVDVRAMASAALRNLTVGDVNLLKAILAAGLYPQVASWLNIACLLLITSSVTSPAPVSLWM